MGKTLWGTVALAVACASAGCTSAPAWLASATEKVPYVGKSKSEQGFPLSGGPDFSKGYEEYSAEYQSRNIVSPAMGLDGPVEPSRTQRWTKAVTGSSVVKGVSTAFKTVKEKTTDVVMPRKGPPPSPVSLATEVGVPSPDLYLTSARVYEKAGDLAGAEAQYRRALDVAPQNMAALLGTAHLYDRQGRLPEAAAMYAQAAELHPTEAAPLNDLGLCLARQNRLAEAAAALEKAVALKPDRKLYRNNVATVMVELGRVDEALAHLASVHGQAVAHHNVGFLLYKLGNTEAAAQHYALASRLDRSLTAGQSSAAGASQSGPTARPPVMEPGAPTRQFTQRQVVPSQTAPRYEAQVAAPPTAKPSTAVVPPPTVHGPVNLPQWSQSPDRQTPPAAPPVPADVDSYQPPGRDPATIGPAPQDLLRHLPPVDPSYIPQSRY